MILYFTGTGNSQYGAGVVQTVLEDEVMSINELLKKDGTITLKSEQPFVFVCPIYAWRIPGVVDQFIRRTNFLGSSDVYFIFTCGAEAGDAEHYISNLCRDKSFNLRGTASVIMPDNYIVMYKPTEKEQAIKLIRAAEKKIMSLSEYIKDGQDFEKEEKSFVDTLKSTIVNPMFYKLFVSAKGFQVTDKCSSCGLCEKVCPLNNIFLVEGKPNWGSKCTHCMACISRCPLEAIEYKNKTKGRTRYYIKF